MTGLLLDATPEMNFGLAANGLPVRAEALDWLRRVVDGEDVRGGARLFVMGTNTWRDEEAWPPPSTPLTLWPDRWGVAGDVNRRAEAATHEFDYDPDDPVPTMGGNSLGPFLPMAGPVDQRAVGVPTRRPRLHHRAADRAADHHRCRHRDHRLRHDGTIGRRHRQADRRAPGRAGLQRRRLRAPPVLHPGSAQEVTVEVGVTAQCFRPGHRLRVHVSSSNFPRFDRNPSDGTPAGEAIVLHGARQTVHLGGARPSSITLPVVAA